MTKPTFNHGTFTSSDDLDIFYQSWTVENPKGLLVISHGLGEHSSRYGHVLDTVLPLGLSVWALDHRGHGRSQGKRGHIKRFDNYIDDLHAFIELVQAKQPGMKTYLLGHSLGGLIALTYALKHPETLEAVISSSALLKLSMEVPKIKAAIGRKLSDIWPSLTLANDIDPKFISHDSREVKSYADDPLVHNKVSTRFFTEMSTQLDYTRTHASDLEIPCLIQAAGDDKLVDPDGSLEFYNHLTVEDKTLFYYDDFYHEIYNEIERERPLSDLAGWLSPRV